MGGECGTQENGATYILATERKYKIWNGNVKADIK
jgi:hypothetical protein